MLATHNNMIERRADADPPVSSRQRKRLAALRRLVSGPVLWLGMPLFALLPLLLE